MANPRSEYRTHSRTHIKQIFERERRFLTAAQIHELLEAQHGCTSLSTIYRTLDHLLEKGEITARLDDKGETAYMPCAPGHHHHHAICRVCGKVEDVDCTALDQLAGSLRSSTGFELDGHAMEFFGKCAACRG
jgi:Fur family ferric uptake transcriptional regulator